MFIKIKDANPDIFSLEIFKISELVQAVELDARTAGKNVNTNNFPKITGLKIFLSVPLYTTFPNNVAIPPANAATWSGVNGASTNPVKAPITTPEKSFKASLFFCIKNENIISISSEATTADNITKTGVIS